jgi:hypothetical protein
MKAIPPRFKPMLAELRKLRRELRELETNPPPRTDPTEAFRQAIRDNLEDKPVI